METDLLGLQVQVKSSCNQRVLQCVAGTQTAAVAIGGTQAPAVALTWEFNGTFVDSRW